MNRKLKLWELERVSEENYKNQHKFPILVVLDDIRSLHNIGTFFRTADAFNVEKIILCGITACPPHREIHKTALGATDTVEWEYEESLLNKLKKLREQEYTLFAVEQSERTVLLQQLDKMSYNKAAFVFGNEVDGINQEAIDYCDVVLEIPQFGTKHSLNVSVCAGIVLWEAVKKELK